MRYYSVDLPNGTKRLLPSVTTVLDVTMPLERRSRLELRKAKNPSQFFQNRDGARMRGTYIHRYVEAKLQGKRMGHGHYGRWLKRLDPWLKNLCPVPTNQVWTEQMVYDLDRGYAGTFDILFDWPGQGYTLIDIKSTAFKGWPEAIASAQLQAAAYAAAWNNRQHALRATHIATVHVSPYSLEVYTTTGPELQRRIEGFYTRLRQFGSRLTDAYA